MNRIIQYCKDSYAELAHNTTWPTRQELTHSAIVVLFASILLALLVFAEDSFFRFVMDLIYPTK